MPALWRTVGAALAAAALLRQGGGLRRKKVRGADTKIVAGVPIYNYDSRHLQHEGAGDREAHAEYDWVLMFKDTTGEQKLLDFCGGTVGKGECRSVGNPSKGGVPFVKLRGTEQRLHKLLEVHGQQVAFGEPDLDMEVPEVPEVAASGAAVAAPWHLDRVGVAGAAHTGKGVHIYVMDTGVRSTHEDFGGRAIPTLDTFIGEGVPTECHGNVKCATDYHGHGTHVAATAGGKAYGVAPEAIIHVMKVCCGPLANTLGGMDYIARQALHPAIMTVSLASKGRWESARVAVDATVAAGVTVMVGAANDNVNTCTMTYGFIPSAISVGATDSADKRARFSNWGECNNIYAPGVAILSAWLDSDTDSRTISGTSMATPMVAGAGALLLEESPTRTPAQVREILLQKATKGIITDLQAGDPDLLLSVV